MSAEGHVDVVNKRRMLFPLSLALRGSRSQIGVKVARLVQVALVQCAGGKWT